MNKELLKEIIENKIGESDTLEFKDYFFDNGKLNSLEYRHILALMKEICSFANANGGKIIIGIKEDNSHNPAGFSDVGVNETTFETWEQSLRNKIAMTTIPNVYGLNVELVPVDDETNCIVIDVQKSVLKPHAFNTGSKDEFYIRNGNISMPMRYNEVKNSFNALEFMQEKIRRFIDERLSFILNGNLDDSLSTDSSLVLHIIPEWSLDESNFLDLKKTRYSNDFGTISPGQVTYRNYNADGVLHIYGTTKKRVMSYVQIFKDACIEATEIRLLNDMPDGLIYNWYDFESIIVERLYQYINGLKLLGISGGFYFTVTLLNVRGRQIKYGSLGECSKPLIHDIVKTPIVKWSEGQPFVEIVYPIVTSLAHCVGLEKSTFYFRDNSPILANFAFMEKFKNL